MSNLETLMVVFIIVTSVAVVIQMGVLVALYLSVKKSSARMESLATQVETRAVPTLDMAQQILREEFDRRKLAFPTEAAPTAGPRGAGIVGAALQRLRGKQVLRS